MKRYTGRSNQSGASMVEYVAIIVLVAMIGLISVGAVGNAVGASLCEATNKGFMGGANNLTWDPASKSCKENDPDWP